MIRLGIAALTGGVLAWGWLATAAYIYLWGVRKLTLFRFPFQQWLIIAPYWRLSWWVTLWVVVAAAVPTVLLVLIAVAVMVLVLVRLTRGFEEVSA